MKRRRAITIIAIVLWVIPLRALAMDAQLHSLPKLAGTTVVWQEESLEINGVATFASHLRVKAPIAGVVSFYKDALINAGWELKEHYVENNTLFFIKKDEFFYVMVIGGLPQLPSDIYLVHSSCDLTICTMLKDYLLQPVLAADVRGRDLDDVERYPQSRRRLSMLAANSAAFIMYETEAELGRVAGFLRDKLKEQSWIEADFIEAKAEGLAILFFYKGGDNLQITIMSAPKGAGKEKNISSRNMIMVMKNLDKEAGYPEPEEGEGAP